MGHNFVRDIVWRNNRRINNEKDRLESYDLESEKCVKCKQVIEREQKEIDRKTMDQMKKNLKGHFNPFLYKRNPEECLKSLPEDATFYYPRPLCMIHWVKWQTMNKKPKTNNEFKQMFTGNMIKAIARSKKKKEKRAVWGAAYDKYIKTDPELVEKVKQ